MASDGTGTDHLQQDSGIQRKLAALFAADVAGYSRLMAADEELTTTTLAQYREIMDGLIAHHGGRIANTAGDSVLAEFTSSVEAVRCAVEIQEALRHRNDPLPSDKRIRFRIGIGVGDVIEREGDLLGDGVNIAARLESLAAPGGICVSSDVRDQIEGKLTLQVQSLGNQRLKNIPRPVRAYQIGLEDGARLSVIAILKRQLRGRGTGMALATLLCVGAAAGVVVYHHLWEGGATNGLSAARDALDRQALEAAAREAIAGRDILRTEAFGGHDYSIVRAEGINWAEADAEARAMGGSLVSITSQAQNDFIAELIQQEESLWQEWKPGHYTGPWIGLLHQPDTDSPEKGWIWVNGAHLGYSNWYEHQPDNRDGNESVARFHHWGGDSKPQWGDASGLEQANGYIVEFE
ncbi:lectin-like protein [Ruegeria jejuensis]|uniref:lectin-like protein n=1 Tax=Ruegeria jejuensis TaxID=3233338 RepID=UPI00355BD520